MGAWGVGALQNDGAMDFVGELAGETTVEKLRDAIADLEAAKANNEFLDTMLTEPALAAAEVLAALTSGDKSHLDPSTVDYVSAITERLTTDDIVRARAAVELLLREGETYDLFEESESFEEWKAEMSALAVRLTPG